MSQRSDDALVERLRETSRVLERITYRPDMAFTASDRSKTFDASKSVSEAADRIATLSARVDLLEGVVEAARLNYNAQEIVFGMVERNQFFPFSDVTKAEEWLTHTHAELHVALAALDAATRSADTDGDGSGLHAPEAREHLARDGSPSARTEAVE